MKIELDQSIDAAYISFDVAMDNQSGWVAKTVTVDPKETYGMINLDFDKDGILRGIEVLAASKQLPKSLLEKSELIG